MEQNLTLEKGSSIAGTLLMLDDITPHVAVPVQAIRDGEVMATALSDDRGQYQFTNLKQGRYQVRCHVLGGYVYYGEGGSTVTDEYGAVFLQVKHGVAHDNIEFHFAPFKKGTWRNYDYLDGLAGNAVFAICRDGDGAMWFATSTGASRYDGKEFTNLTARDGLLSDYIWAIHCDPDGVMWFGTFADGVSRYDGQVINLTTEDGLVDNGIRAIHQSSDGVMWFGANGGVSRYDGKEFVNLTIEDGLASNYVTAINSDPDGTMWFGTNSGISRYDGVEFVSFTTKDGLVDNVVNAIYSAPDGVVWFGTDGGVSRYDGEKFINLTTEDGLADNEVRAIHRDPDGAMWFGTCGSIGGAGRGVSRYDGKRFVNFTTEDGLAYNYVNAIYSDTDGVMWFALWPGGVSRYDPNQLVNFTTKELLANDAIPDGPMWFATRGGVCQCDGRDFVNFTRFIIEKELADVWVSIVHRDSDGVMWFAPFSWPTGAGVFRYDGKELVKFTTEDGLASNYITDIHSDPDGTMWFGTWRGGVSRYDGKDFVNFTTEDGLVCNDINAICRDPDGVMWFGAGYWGSPGGVSRYDGKEFVNFTIEDGLADNTVWAIHHGPDGMMWFATAWGGVSRYDGRGTGDSATNSSRGMGDFPHFVNFTTEDGLACNWIRIIYSDHDRVVWFGTRWGGVSGYDGTAWTSLDTRDGLASNEIRSIFQDSDGSLWFREGQFLTRYRRSAIPPRVYIVSVTTDQTYRLKTQDPRLKTESPRIPAFTSGTRVTIEYNSIDFKTLPEKRQYRCSVYEARGDEHAPSPPRSLAPSYLPPTKATTFDWIPQKPGIYVFQVQAIDRDLNYSEPALVKLEVIPDPRDLKVSELESDLKVTSQQLAFLQQEVERKYHFENIIGDSEAMEWVRAMMDLTIDSGQNLLITGDTGTGKELVAKGIHYNSSRKDKPLITFNCGAIQKELVASELFGHRKGAFTGAIEDKMGLFEVAQGGTVALDEMGDMPLDVQANLLRVLEERKVQRIGEYTLRDVDVRVIAMTNRDLLEEVEKGRFREDLYYRLNGFHIYIPPLRQRTDDLPLLAEHFYQEACREQDKELGGFAPDVIGMLTSYPWPGNVRELRNEIHRACVLAGEGSRVQVYHFSPQITKGESLIQEVLSEQLGLSASLKRLQRRMIEDALRETDGNRTQAAKLLDMDTANLRKLIRRLGIKA